MYAINGAIIPNKTVFYELAIQTNTFYILNCTNSLAGSGPVFPGSIGGASKQRYWVLEPGNRAFSPKTLPDEAPRQSAEGALGIARRAFGLGVNVAPGTFELTDSNTFSATTVEGGKLKGHFVGFNGDLPTGAEYKIDMVPNSIIRIHYDYSQEVHPRIPSASTFELIQNGSAVQNIVYRILTCEFGIIDLAEGILLKMRSQIKKGDCPWAMRPHNLCFSSVTVERSY